MDRPPEWIDVSDIGVVLRRHRTDDIDAFHAIIEASRDHLRPYMPWADQTRDDTAAFIGRTAEMWHAGSDFSYLVTRPHDIGSDEIEQLLGGCGLHARLGPGALEIGYWLRHDATRGGVMTAVARRLTAVAFALTDIDRVEIHCDQSNGRSAAIPQRLGYTLDRLVDQPIAAAGEQGRSMVWVTHRSPIPPAPPAP